MVARMKVKPGKGPEYEALMDHVCAMVRAHEPGVPYYAWARDAEEPDTYVVIEVYRDAEVHAAHMASQWVRESLPVSMALIEGRPEIRQYVSDGSAPVRLTLKG